MSLLIICFDSFTIDKCDFFLLYLYILFFQVSERFSFDKCMKRFNNNLSNCKYTCDETKFRACRDYKDKEVFNRIVFYVHFVMVG